MTTGIDTAALIRDHTPVLVLYPEIPRGSKRTRDDNYPHVSPLAHDYHPRDIRMVLEHSSLHSRFGRGGSGPGRSDEMLDRMEKADFERDLDVLPGAKPDDRERFWKAYGDIEDKDAKYPRACYARSVWGKGVIKDRVLVQYWYPYFYNDFWNTHEMDWETVMIVFKVQGSVAAPTLCAYSAHMGGHWLPWSGVDKADARADRAASGTHPIVYVANGSHANYFYESGMFITAPPLVDMAAKLVKKNRRLVDYTASWEDGSRHLVTADIIPESPDKTWRDGWRWLNQEGRWGSPGEFLDLEFGDSGPLGPPQGGDRWDSPFRWIDTSCTLAPSKEESRVPSML